MIGDDGLQVQDMSLLGIGLGHGPNVAVLVLTGGLVSISQCHCPDTTVVPYYCSAILL